VLLKAALLLLLVLLGATARHLSAARSPRSLRNLHRVMGTELVVVAGALAATAFLTGVPAPSLPAQTVRVIQAPGKPTLYSIGFTGGRVLDIYLDPGTAGVNELHGTFTDAQGRQLDIARAPEVTAIRRGEPPRTLPVLREGPGHFFSDAAFTPGEWTLEVTAVMRTGEVLRAHLTIHL
jgi:hypothetical protein